MRISPRQCVTTTRNRRSILHPGGAFLSAAHPRGPAPIAITPPPAHLRQLRQSRGQITARRAAPRGRTMASDEDYMAFLDKANKDLDEGKAHAQSQAAGGSKTQFKAMDAGMEAPSAISKVCQSEVYVSDADEPFEAVSLKYSGSDLPDETEFAKLIHHWDTNAAEIDIMDPLDWDSNGRYGKVIDAVREASRGNDVRVYRVTRDQTRVEYWVVTREEGRIVGVKALGVES
ncbi:hypothetical protein JDV02_006225 [Purpureocillium takamizusanense]|uniref:Uncharacterized protein n=1 Tax=Purpureocillium takamizusanense TaxID=2060973 RepID=A0A9Q8QJS6_9HYPO|nr:uncharacterized protein JDV02_006225 [Purpureocillium takamizusanense]UNI20101.1 hypothetical protein JDV02_006225 [Purpureocillium takamizusanense]